MRARIGWRALARYVAGESSAAESAAIEAWAAADPRHAELLREARRSWQSADVSEPAPDPDAAWRTLSARLEPGGRTAPATRTTHPAERARPAARPLWRRPATWAWGGLAAAAAIAALLAVPQLREEPTAPAPFTVATGAAEVSTVRLGDGSVVRLAPNTTLKAAAGARREAWLEGTAFFAIAKRHGVPFVVHTPGGEARVLGTRFELRTQVRSVRLAVFEGRVALSAPGGREVVEAGQVSEVEAGRAPTAPRAADVQTMVGWMKGVLIFEATPLRQAAREIQRQYGVPVRLADPALGDRTVNAVFDHQSLETVVATICRVTDATCQVEDSVVWVRP